MKIMHKEHIFEPGKWMASCHASTLVKLPGGSMAAAWFGGTREGHPDVGIWVARRMDGTWSEPKRVAGNGDLACWNPVLTDRGDKTLLLYYKEGAEISLWRTMVMESQDGGASFSPSREAVPGDIGGRGPVKNKILQLPGRWIAGGSLESDRAWEAFADISLDEGRTWRRVAVPADRGRFRDKGVIQPALWAGEGQRVHMLLRSTEGCLWRSDSEDGGESWCPAYPTNLPNNNSGIDAVRLGGRLVLVYNPVQGNWGPRTPLVCALSKDNGQTFIQTVTIEDGVATEQGLPCEFSYPAVIAQEGMLWITYTWNRKTIGFVQIKIEG